MIRLIALPLLIFTDMSFKQAVEWVKGFWHRNVVDAIPTTSELAGNVQAILATVENAKTGTDLNIAANMLESFKEKHSYLLADEMKEFVTTLEGEILAKRRALWLHYCEDELAGHCN